MAARGFKGALHRFQGPREEDERSGLLRSHNQIVPVTEDDLDDEQEQPSSSSLAVHAELKTVALMVSMHCHGCARKVERQISKLQGVVSFKVELESKKVTVVGNVTAVEVLESISKAMKRAQILAVS